VEKMSLSGAHWTCLLSGWKNGLSVGWESERSNWECFLEERGCGAYIAVWGSILVSQFFPIYPRMLAQYVYRAGVCTTRFSFSGHIAMWLGYSEVRHCRSRLHRFPQETAGAMTFVFPKYDSLQSPMYTHNANSMILSNVLHMAATHRRPALPPFLQLQFHLASVCDSGCAVFQ
jgi:hypothetical protein